MNRNVIIIIAVAAALVSLSCCCATGVFLFGRGNGYELSDEQEAVIADFGQPDDFTIMFGEIATDEFNEDGDQPVHRVEYWNYRDSRIGVVFRDGRFVRQTTLEPLPAGKWTYPALQPTQIAEKMPAEKVVELIGKSPDKAIKTGAKSGMGLVTVSFEKQVQATFEDGELVMLETRPVKVASK